MEIHQGWNEDGKKVTVIRVSRHDANSWTAWDSTMANPTTQWDAEGAFRSMLTTARKVVRGFETGTPIEADSVAAPIRNLYAWYWTCKRFVESRRVALRTARRTIASPADYQGTQTTPFCELAVMAVDQLIRQLWHFVESREHDEAEQVQAASSRGEKLNVNPIHADDLLRLVAMELEAYAWTNAGSASMSDLKAMIQCEDNQPVVNYLIAAGLPRATRGQKKWKLAPENVIVFLRQVIDYPTTGIHAQFASSELQKRI